MVSNIYFYCGLLHRLFLMGQVGQKNSYFLPKLIVNHRSVSHAVLYSLWVVNWQVNQLSAGQYNPLYLKVHTFLWLPYKKSKVHIQTIECKKQKQDKWIRPPVKSLSLYSQDASSIVSVVCGTNKIAWTHVDRGMTVLDWQQLECPNFLKGTYMASAYLNDVSMTFRVCVLCWYFTVTGWIIQSFLG